MNNILDAIKRGFAGRAQKVAPLITPNGSVAFSCVIDRDPRFVFQAARLLLSLRWFGGRLSNAPFYLCSTSKLSAEAKDFFIRHGCRLSYCEPFDSRRPLIPSNKLRGLEISDLKKFEHVILIDSDILIVQDPSHYCAVIGVGLKIADLPTVEDEILRATLQELEVKVPKRTFDYELSDAKTFGYFNSGVVVIARDWLEIFTETWTKRCRQLLALEHSKGISNYHTNQSALAATIAELDIPLKVLPASMNLPVHLQADAYPDWYHDIDPQFIHYHWLSNEWGFIQTLPLRMANLRANLFNARLRAEIQAAQKESLVRQEIKKNIPRNGRPKIVVGSGWWCDKKSHDWAKGADITRKTVFFSLWLRQVERYLDPDRIVITDSNSPLKPDWQSHPKINWIVLDKNYGQPNDVRVGKIKTKLSGFTKSVISGAMYALCCDADFYVYVEQDCLIRGEDFLRHAIDGSDADIFLGQRTKGGKGIEGRPAAPMVQQSLIVVRKSGLERFISRTICSPETDGELSPEIKMDQDLKPYDFLKIPYGRSRPIDFSRSHFYVQHLENEELEKFLAIEGLSLSILDPKEEEVFNL